jgi:hypothetical protein
VVVIWGPANGTIEAITTPTSGLQPLRARRRRGCARLRCRSSIIPGTGATRPVRCRPYSEHQAGDLLTEPVIL